MFNSSHQRDYCFFYCHLIRAIQQIYGGNVSKFIRFILVAILIVSFAASPLVEVQAQGTSAQALAPIKSVHGQIIPNQYIVVLKPAATLGTRTSAVKSASSMGARVLYEYDSTFSGFAATLSAAALLKLRKNPQVAYIEPDQVAAVNPVIKGTGVSALNFQDNATWGLDRLDQINLPLNGLYRYIQTGLNSNVYVLDTGINSGHSELTGRVVKAYDTYGKKGNDCNGHGTYVASLVAGKTYGVAKSAKIYNVRILDCSGRGTYSRVIAGINWVTKHHVDRSIAVLTIHGGDSTALNDAIEAAVTDGVTFSLGADMGANDSCDTFPTMAVTDMAGAIVAGATDPSDNLASFTNRGDCVDIYAPGVAIISGWKDGTSSVKMLSGTDSSAAYTAGVAALYLQTYPTATPAEIEEGLAPAIPTADAYTIDTKPFLNIAVAGKPAYSNPPTPISPRGIINSADGSPKIIFAPLGNPGEFASYEIYIYKDSTLVESKNYLPADCGNDTDYSNYCVYDSTKITTIGNYSWKVRARKNSTTATAFSPSFAFSVINMGADFTSPFTANSTGWSSVAGGWHLSTSDGTYFTHGVKDKFTSATYTSYYADLDYSVKMRRTGACIKCSNYIIIRGVTAPLALKTNEWYSGLEFVYINTGYYAIWKIDHNSYTPIVNWTASPNIINKGWNTLRVTASGDSFEFYINDTVTPVWAGTIATNSFGRIGFGMKTDIGKDKFEITNVTVTPSAWPPSEPK